MLRWVGAAHHLKLLVASGIDIRPIRLNSRHEHENQMHRITVGSVYQFRPNA
jgi:hypothetical protein